MIFFDKTCTIKEITTTYPNWEAVDTENTIYTDITCDFFKMDEWWTGVIKQDWFFVEWTHYDYVVVLKWDKSLVRKHMIVELTNELGDYWEYIISDMLPYKRISWIVDNIALKVIEKAKWSI